MMNTTAMRDEMLTKVTGGNYGDSSFEKRSCIPMYYPGDIVEVYTNFLHIFTNRGKIVKLKFQDFDKPYKYLVEFLDGNIAGNRDWYEASDFEYDCSRFR